MYFFVFKTEQNYLSSKNSRITSHQEQLYFIRALGTIKDTIQKAEKLEFVFNSANEQPYQWLNHASYEIYQNLIEGRDDKELIGSSVLFNEFTEGCLWMSLRPIERFKPKEFWDKFFRAVRNQAKFQIDRTLIISVAFVRPPVGTRRRKLMHDQMKKRSISSMSNDKNVCLPRVSLAYSIRGQQREGKNHDCLGEISKQNRKQQKIQANFLLDDARVVV